MLHCRQIFPCQYINALICSTSDKVKYFNTKKHLNIGEENGIRTDTVKDDLNPVFNRTFAFMVMILFLKSIIHTKNTLIKKTLVFERSYKSN